MDRPADMPIMGGGIKLISLAKNKSSSKPKILKKSKNFENFLPTSTKNTSKSFTNLGNNVPLSNRSIKGLAKPKNRLV